MEVFSPPRENFLYFRKRRSEKFLIFSQNKACLMLQETENPKKFLIFQEMELSYFLRVSNTNLYILHHNIPHQNYYNKFLWLL